jgi:hypothetical protein
VLQERHQPGVSKRAMERHAAIEMEAQRLAQAEKEAKLKLQAMASSDAGQAPQENIAGVMSAREKRIRDKERQGPGGFKARRRFGV